METLSVNRALSLTGEGHNSYTFYSFFSLIVNIDFSNNIGKSMMANNRNTQTKGDFSIDSFCDVYCCFLTGKHPQWSVS